MPSNGPRIALAALRKRRLGLKRLKTTWTIRWPRNSRYCQMLMSKSSRRRVRTRTRRIAVSCSAASIARRRRIRAA